MTTTTIRSKLLRALEKEMTGCGLPSRKHAADAARALEKGNVPRGIGSKDAAATAVAMAFYEGFARLRVSDEAELKKVIARLPQILRELRPVLGRFNKDLMATLPRSGGPGRAPLLSTEEQREVCDRIGRLIAKGEPLRDAFVAVAAEYTATHQPVSAKTVKRIWERRAKIRP